MAKNSVTVAAEHSARFDDLKYKWDNGYIAEDTLRGWVKLNETKPGKGITAAEFKEITGKDY